MTGKIDLILSELACSVILKGLLGRWLTRCLVAMME